MQYWWEFSMALHLLLATSHQHDCISAEFHITHYVTNPPSPHADCVRQIWVDRDPTLLILCGVIHVAACDQDGRKGGGSVHQVTGSSSKTWAVSVCDLQITGQAWAVFPRTEHRCNHGGSYWAFHQHSIPLPPVDHQGVFKAMGWSITQNLRFLTITHAAVLHTSQVAPLCTWQQCAVVVCC